MNRVNKSTEIKGNLKEKKKKKVPRIKAIHESTRSNISYPREKCVFFNSY